MPYMDINKALKVIMIMDKSHDTVVLTCTEYVHFMQTLLIDRQEYFCNGKYRLQITDADDTFTLTNVATGKTVLMNLTDFRAVERDGAVLTQLRILNDRQYWIDTCQGCLFDQPGQMAHQGGCLPDDDYEDER